MKRRNNGFSATAQTLSVNVALAVSLFALFALPTVAQEDTHRSVTDLTGKRLTSERLVEALRPQVEPPLLTRSLTPTTCDRFHNQQSRGIRPEPVSEDIALTVEFASDSAELTPQARSNLDVLGQALSDPVLANCCFRIEGHTDSENTDDYNLRLSAARAQSVAQYLKDNFGIAIDQLLQDALGESQPLATNDTVEGRQKNRRVQVTTLGFRLPEGGP